ncbi:zinc finger protein OZF-like isoform X2 [Bacillus rossius redtenbacheri]|uniref:zinc finger protein OZF-like isoform X2 n=1 Tax=Bacillus rossius redtenbacheri TaxID=93214 RepID=UPI002FDDBC6E
MKNKLVMNHQKKLMEMDWWSEDAFGNECWSIGLERLGRTVYPTIKQESNELVEDNYSHEVKDKAQSDCKYEDDSDVDKDDSSHEDTSKDSIIVLSSDSSMAACDITFPNIKMEVAEEKEYKEVTIGEEQIVYESSEESNVLLAAPKCSKTFKTDIVTCVRTIDSVESTSGPGCTPDVQSRRGLEQRMLNHCSDFSGKIDQECHTNDKRIKSHNLIQTKQIRSLNLTCSPEVGVFNEAVVKPVSCFLCKDSFDDTRALKQHIINHAKNAVYVNKVCRKKHAQNLMRRKPFSCALCHKIFFTKPSLRIHVHTHTIKESLSLPLGGETISHKGHTSRRSFSCSLCCAKFPKNKHLISHKCTHRGKKPFSCKICGAKFSQKSHRNFHIRTHTGEKPFSCSVCSAKFSRNDSLKLHMRIHTGEKPFSCSVCSAKFSRKYNLTLHIRTHTGEKPFSCSICNAKFTWKSSLNSHVHTHKGKILLGML